MSQFVRPICYHSTCSCLSSLIPPILPPSTLFSGQLKIPNEPIVDSQLKREPPCPQQTESTNIKVPAAAHHRNPLCICPNHSGSIPYAPPPQTAPHLQQKPCRVGECTGAVRRAVSMQLSLSKQIPRVCNLRGNKGRVGIRPI